MWNDSANLRKFASQPTKKKVVCQTEKQKPKKTKKPILIKIQII